MSVHRVALRVSGWIPFPTNHHAKFGTIVVENEKTRMPDKIGFGKKTKKCLGKLECNSIFGSNCMLVGNPDTIQCEKSTIV